ncbi:hypothetical protein HYV81_05555 [Candidatus Woesearchaeota archaeon]|nr:hypothetical protein [Candidatus Woesearchaeota archaeon]
MTVELQYTSPELDRLTAQYPVAQVLGATLEAWRTGRFSDSISHWLFFGGTPGHVPDILGGIVAESAKYDRWVGIRLANEPSFVEEFDAERRAGVLREHPEGTLNSDVDLARLVDRGVLELVVDAGVVNAVPKEGFPSYVSERVARHFETLAQAKRGL